MKITEFRKIIREEIREVLKETISTEEFDFAGFASYLKSIGVVSKEFYNPKNYRMGDYGRRPGFETNGGDSLLKDFEKLKNTSKEDQQQILKYFIGKKPLDRFHKTYGFPLQVAIQPTKKTFDFWITSETSLMIGSGLNKKTGFQEFTIRLPKKIK